MCGPHSRKYLTELIDMSGDSDIGVLKTVAVGLGDVQAPEAAAALESIVMRTQGDMRANMLYQLAQTRQPSEIPFVRKYLKDPNRDVRRTAKYAIASLERAAIRP